MITVTRPAKHSITIQQLVVLTAAESTGDYGQHHSDIDGFYYIDLDRHHSTCAGKNQHAVPELALPLISLSIAPVLFLVVYAFTRRIKKASRDVRKKESEIVSKTQEVFSSIRVVKAFGQEKYERKRFDEVSLETVELSLRARALKAGLSPGIRVMTALGTALMMWYGARMVIVEQAITPEHWCCFSPDWESCIADSGLSKPRIPFPSPRSLSSGFKK